MYNSIPQILLVEDNEGDIMLTQEAFEECQIKCNLSISRDGEEALNFLYKKNGFEQEKTPDLILLDINLPRYNGHEILKTIKANDKLKKIPVVMLTTSNRPKDIELAYSNYCSAFVSKPTDINDFTDAVASINKFWFSTATLKN